MGYENWRYVQRRPDADSFNYDWQDLEKRFANLSPRQLEVARLFVEGNSEGQIASLLSLSVGTIKAQRHQI
jgi:DNA-binding NarL/FixJ family response regulator